MADESKKEFSEKQDMQTQGMSSVLSLPELDAIRADETNTCGRPRGWIVWMGYRARRNPF